MKTKYMFAYIASLALVSACGQQSDDSAPEAADTATEAANDGMVLPATTASDAAHEHYMAGWADFENSRFNSANSKFLDAAAADPSFAMAHLMASLSAASTESFAANLGLASANKAEATRGEQLLIGAFERAFAADTQGWIAALQELTTLHPDSPRAWLFLGNAYGNENNSADARAAYGKAIELDPSFVPGSRFYSRRPV